MSEHVWDRRPKASALDVAAAMALAYAQLASVRLDVQREFESHPDVQEAVAAMERWYS